MCTPGGIYKSVATCTSRQDHANKSHVLKRVTSGIVTRASNQAQLCSHQNRFRMNRVAHAPVGAPRVLDGPEALAIVLAVSNGQDGMVHLRAAAVAAAATFVVCGAQDHVQCLLRISGICCEHDQLFRTAIERDLGLECNICCTQRACSDAVYSAANRCAHCVPLAYCNIDAPTCRVIYILMSV